jgi:hypothetical protein
MIGLRSREEQGGHSKWATTKHQKAVKDARRGKEFARLIQNIEVAARTGGGDPSGNPTLALGLVLTDPAFDGARPDIEFFGLGGQTIPSEPVHTQRRDTTARLGLSNPSRSSRGAGVRTVEILTFMSNWTSGGHFT